MDSARSAASGLSGGDPSAPASPVQAAPVQVGAVQVGAGTGAAAPFAGPGGFAGFGGGRPVVLQLTPALESGGVERGTIEIAQALTREGATSLVASRGGRMERMLERAGGRLVRLDIGAKNPLAIRRNAAALERILREERVDIVHARSRAPAWAGWLAARRAGVPFVTTWHGDYSENFPGKRLWNGIMARGRPTIAVSEFIADTIRTRHPEADLVVIPRGADLAQFDPLTIQGARSAGLAERWGLADDPRPVVMLPGRLTRWKGQSHFIDAAAKLRALRGGEDFVFLMVGDDPDSAYGRELAERIRSQGLTGCCAMAGHCDDMAAALKLASVVVSASMEPEAFGRVAVEAQAMGRPVIATDHGGARETVDEGRTGWRYPPGDADALAAAANRALDLDASAREHMAMAGRARIMQRFSTEAMQRATLQVYAGVLARG